MSNHMKVTINILLAFISLFVWITMANAQNTNSTNTQASQGGPIRKLHNKIHNMRPRVKMRKAMQNKMNKAESSEKSKTLPPPAAQ